jgi:hypothetical protein
MSEQLLLACGVAVGPLFSVVYLLAGAVRADYKQLRHPVSSLALGPSGWVQRANFFVAGLLSLAFAVGLWRAGASRWGAVLIGVWAVGLLGAGAFRTDPVRGYPSGTPDLPERASRQGALHDLFSSAAFLAMAVACFVLGLSGSPGWAVYSVASGVLFTATMALSSAAFSGNRRLAGLGGLIQRASLTLGWAWLALLAVRALRA